MTDKDAPQTYLSLLKNAKFQSLHTTKNFKAVPGEPQVGISVTPPCTCDILFQQGTFKLAMKRFSVSPEELKTLPESWQNFVTNKNDKNIENKFKLVTTPQQQGGCGSCFAVAIATTISDNFLFGMNLDYNPSISPMYILSCLKGSSNLQCAGGNPSIVIDDIIHKGGVSTNCCLNYDALCSANQFCNIEGSKHLDKGVQVTKDSMNSMIPECGCCTSEPPKIYQIKNKTVAFDVPMIKRHLMKYGSAVGGFMVYKNFIKDINHGKFLETKGIYIHNVNYSGKEEDIEDCAGGHAIAIVGWGVEKDLKVGDHIYPKVEYWICRNSWSEKWGNDGYFKYALFQEYSDAKLPPINKNIAFETDNKLLGQANLGGILLVEPAEIQTSNKLTKVKCDATYTCKELESKPIVDIIYTICTKNKFIKFILFFSIILLFALLVSLYIRVSKVKRKKI